MKSFKKEKTKPLKKYSILATDAEIMYLCFHKNFKQTNETNHTYYRWNTFGQKYLCGKAGAQPLAQPRLPRYGTYMGDRKSVV